MRNAKRTILIAMLICVGFVPVCSARSRRGKAKPVPMSVSELLDKYAETQDKQQSYITKSETSFDHHHSRFGKGQNYESGEIRFDGNRNKWIHKTWGNVKSEKDFIPKNEAIYTSYLWDGKWYLRNSKAIGYDPARDTVVINKNKKVFESQESIYMGTGHSLRGVFFGDGERIDSILRTADVISVQDEMGTIGGCQHYVIEAKTKHGEYEVWIDPEHGYNITKAMVHKRKNDIAFHGKYILKNQESVFTSLNKVRFEKIDGVWVPMEADIITEFNRSGGYFTRSKIHHKQTEVILNPDHEALGSFLPNDVRNGAKVTIVGIDNIRYTWQNGKVVDKKGRVIMDCRPKKASGSAESRPKSAGRKRPSAWELLRRYATQKAKVTAPRSKERVVHFPNDRSLGKLFISDEIAKWESRPFAYWFEGTKWLYIGHAQGDVKVPPGKRLKLILSSWTWEKPDNLSALKQLKPDDIYSLILSHEYSPGKRRPNDRCMPYVAHLTGLKTLKLWGANITSQGLKYITEIKSLERLHLPARVNNSGMVYVGKLKSLKVLYFGGNNLVTNDGLAQLSNLKSLEELCLHSVRMTDKGLQLLSTLPRLHYLILGGNFTDNAFLYLKDVPSLRTLSLGIKRFTDRGMKNISGLTQLENFTAHWIESITDKGVAHLKNMPSLKKLDIGHAQLTDRAMLDLKQIRTLEYLHLPNRGLTDAGLKHIAELQNLRYLWVGGSSRSPLTDESLRYVGQLKNLEKLNIGGAGFSDNGIKHIAKLTNLKSLILFKADQLTNKGLAELASLQSLTRLLLGRSTKISVSGLKSLNSLKKLKDLTIRNIAQDNSGLNIAGLTNLEKLTFSLKATRKGRELIYEEVRDEDLACLANLTRLKSLHLAGAGISDEGIKHLSGLTNLEYLSIVGQCRITDVGLKHLANMQKLYRLRIHDGHFSDRALQYLEDLPSLYWLELTSDNAFSKRAIRRFKEKNPNLTQLQLVP